MGASTKVTGTNINESQQHGIAVSYNGTVVRGEVMALLGNYQLNPDAHRQRGYAGFVELSLAPWAAAGVSRMVTYARIDNNATTPHTIRQVHGLFTRPSPKELLQQREPPCAERLAPKTSTRSAVSGIVKTDHDVLPPAP